MILSDIIMLITDLTSDSSILSNKMGEINSGIGRVKRLNSRNSIKHRTKDLILQYPVLTSNSISSDAVQITSRALEHEYVNILTVLMNSEIQHEVSNKGDATAAEYLKNYHTNIYRRRSSFSESVSVSEMTKANQELLVSFEESINSQNLNNLSFPNSILTEAKNSQNQKVADLAKSIYNRAKEQEKRNADTSKELNKKQNDLNQQEREINKRTRELDKRQNELDRRNAMSTSADAGIQKMEIKKLNDMTPTLVKTVIKVKDKDAGIFDKAITFGVKCVVHPLQSEDIIYYLSDSVRDSSKFFRLIQWTTGEIKFFRDLVASLDTVKKTAVTSVKRDSFWWRKLQSMSKDNLLRRLFDKSGGPIPTATLLVSKQDIDAIKNRYGVDLLNQPIHVEKIMKKLFLLGFVIVDESIRIAYIYNEVSRDFDYYTFNALKDFGKEETTDMDITKTLMK